MQYPPGNKFKILLTLFQLILFFQASAKGEVATQNLPEEVTISQSKLTIPTYTFGSRQSLAPIFEAASQKGLYPYASLDRDSLRPEAIPVEYDSITLENSHLKIVVVPELGGRIWSAWDKDRERHLFYYTEVIKPSSYNQRGAWPAGNLEVYGPYDAHMLTWPGEPWVWSAGRHSDGSSSITLSHIDHFFRNKISMKITLYPKRNFIELTVKLYNRTKLPNRYLLWTNAGISATNGTRFLYPMTRTIGHDSAEFGTWPEYNGVDLSWYRNNQVMLGVFGLDIYDNYMGAYDYDADFGTICYANRNIARGIKTWTWGVGQVGLRHVDQYTDSGIPYIEVQSGRFVWDGNYEFIEPGKSDGWTEYWFGASDLGGLTTSTKDVSIHFDFNPDQPMESVLKASSTGNFPDALLYWQVDDSGQSSDSLPMKTGLTVEKVLPLDGIADSSKVHFKIVSDGSVLLDYSHKVNGTPPASDVASEFIPRDFGPSDSLATEELFQKGLTLEKLGKLEEAKATYAEVLARDPQMTRPNIQLGLLAWSSLETESAIGHFEQALRREPFNGDALYYLAVIHSELGNSDASRRLLYRLTPSSSKFEQRDFELGLLLLREGNYASALPLLSTATRNLPSQMSIRQARTFALRKLGQVSEATEEISEILSIDPTNAFARAESALLGSWSQGKTKLLNNAVAHHAQGFLELGTEYMGLGAWEEVDQILSHAMSTLPADQQSNIPYYRALALTKLGEVEMARALVKRTSQILDPIDVFPFRRESVATLRNALSLSPEDSNAAALLGILLYMRSHRAEAKVLWEESLTHNDAHFPSLQHLGWALVEEGRTDEALGVLARAFKARPDDLGTATAVIRLYSRLGSINEALSTLSLALSQSPGNDRLVELQIKLSALNDDYDEALRILNSHRFDVRHQSYSLLHLYRAVHTLKACQLAEGASFNEALMELQLAANPPENLGLDDFATLSSSRLQFFEALVYSLAGDEKASQEVWQRVARSADQDYDGEGMFRAIGLFMTGDRSTAEEWFEEFESVNQLRKTDSDLQVRGLAYHLSGIYSIFRGNMDAGRQQLQQALEVDESDLFSRQALLWMQSGLFKSFD